jgi:hypothetical protein
MSEASKETHTMSIEIVDIADSILTVQITGTLAQARSRISFKTMSTGLPTPDRER